MTGPINSERQGGQSALQSKKVEPDNHLQSAGECFMFLCWAESVMRDLLVLGNASDDLRRSYNRAYGVESHPSDFTRERLELGRRSFGRIKNQFLCKWPEWKDRADIHEAMERIVIYRNGFGHAQVQPFRQYLLYTPSQSAIKGIREFMRCKICHERLKDCECKRDDMAAPFTLLFRCLDREFLAQLYGDIRQVDQECFLATAKQLDVAYQGVAWPGGKEYALAEHRPIALV